jgi:outer membrane protein assembly factor BamB
MRRFLPLLPILVLIAGCGGSSGSSSSSSTSSGPIAPTRSFTGAAADPSFAPWPGFARDARHSGAAAVVGPQQGKIRWQRKLEGAAVPGPAVGKGDVVYAASNGGVLHAIDLKTGHDIWSFDGGGTYGKDTSTTPALMSDGTILWPGPNSTLFALNPSGHLLWKEELSAQPLSPVVMKDGSIVVGDIAGELEDLVPHGSAGPTVGWMVELGDTSFGSPALGADGTVYTTTEKALVAVRDGRVLWQFPAKSPSEVSAAVAPDGTVVFGTNDSEYGVSPEGNELWRHPNGTRTFSSPIVTHDGLAYYGDNKGSVTVLDAKTGETIARVGTEDPPGVWTAVAVDGHHDLYYGTASGHIYGFDAAGHQLFALKVGGPVVSYPALAADGTLLIGSEDGTLYALE